ncbi:MAG: hypothetical protein GC178_18180 [Flavobacteriales bacterium]|nr:hypothetical protein [Flavobacteriales bacterium]
MSIEEASGVPEHYPLPDLLAHAPVWDTCPVPPDTQFRLTDDKSPFKTMEAVQSNSFLSLQNHFPLPVPTVLNVRTLYPEGLCPCLGVAKNQM